MKNEYGNVAQRGERGMLKRRVRVEIDLGALEKYRKGVEIIKQSN